MIWYIVCKMIKQQGSQYCVFSEDGEKNLGCYDTRSGAEERLFQVEYFKRQDKEYGDVVEVKEKPDKPLNKPFRLPDGSSKKFGVYVKDGDKVKKVTFGDPNMSIKKDDDEARKNFRERHSCDTATDKTSARYWSCRMWEKDANLPGKEQHRFCVDSFIEVKEVDGKKVVKGYIATTHKDVVNDIIAKDTLDLWAKEINTGNPRSNKVSYHHDRDDVRVVGRGIEGTARVDQLPDGHYGLYVESEINTAHPDYAIISKEIDSRMIDSFSIEYIASSQKEGRPDSPRVLDESTQLFGWTLASRPVNEHAVMVKEILGSQHLSSKENGVEETTMSEEKQTGVSEAELKELQELREYKEKMKQKQEDYESKPGRQSQEEGDTEEEEKAKKKKLEDEKKKMEEEKMKMKKEIFSDIFESKEFADKLDAAAEKPKMENKEQPQISIEKKEYIEAMQNRELEPRTKLEAAATFAISNGVLENGTGLVDSRLQNKGFDHVRTNGTRLEVKSYGLSTNTASDGSATETAANVHAELVEALDAGIFNLLNDNVSAYDALPKSNAAGSGSDHASFVVRAGRNPTAGAYTGSSVSTGNTGKYKYSTKFKKYKAGFSIDGDLIAANRGAPQGSVLASEIEFATLDLKKEVNTDLYTEQGAESAAKIIGMEFVADGAGNATLYGETRSSANGLLHGTAANTYKSGATGSLKQNIRTLVKNIQEDGGSRRSIRIFMHPTQMARLKGEEDNSLRYDPGASNVGFAAQLTFEGIPVIEDVDCPEAKVFVVDSASVEIRFWVPPTVEMLGKRGDLTEGFVKSYLAAIYKAPRRVTMLHSVPTS